MSTCLSPPARDNGQQIVSAVILESRCRGGALASNFLGFGSFRFETSFGSFRFETSHESLVVSSMRTSL